MRGMRPWFAAVLLVTQGGAATLAHADVQMGAIQAPPATRESVLKLMHVSGVDDMLGQMAGGYEDQARKNVKGAPKAFWKVFHNKLDPKLLTEQVIGVYQKYLSEKDARAATAFYKTPEGQHMLKAGPSIMQGVEMVVQMAGASAAQEYCTPNPTDKFCMQIREQQQAHQQQQPQQPQQSEPQAQPQDAPPPLLQKQ